MSNGLLDGLVVLDLTRVLAGPYAGMLLADMGATVYKVEMPNVGDDSRAMGPFVNKQSVYFANFNRGKVGITLNLKAPEGKEIFKELVKKADVLIENYRPGTMEKLGLGYDVLKEVNPKLVYGAVSGFGHTGPYSKRAGYDIVGQAMGGLMSTSGWPGGSPTRTGTPMGDVLGGLNLAVGVLAAVLKAQKSGTGEKVDISLVDSVVSSMQNINMIYLSTGRIPERIGNRYESTYPYDSFKTKTTDVIIGAGNDKLYYLLCDLMERPDLKVDPRFVHVVDRVANHKEMKEEIEERSGMKAMDIYGLSETLGPGVGCSCSCCNQIHINADHFWPEIVDPETGAPLPDGELGELVFSSVTKEATPLVRYNTHDLTRLYHGKCACGRTTPRIDKITGRGDDMLIIRGVNLFPSQIEEAIGRHKKDVVINYLIHVDRVNNSDTIYVEVESKKPLTLVESPDAIKKSIEADITAITGLHIKIKLVDPNTLPKSVGKAKRVIDTRFSK